MGSVMNSSADAGPEGFSETDRRFMALAIRLARRGRGSTYPNPAVGAVIVRDGTILGQGFHRRAGQRHAEREALRDCSERGHSPAGATLYVTLEPCAHHGRTPPCTEAILEAGLRRVVVARRDPNTTVPGKGCERLSTAGIEVATGLLEAEAREINEEYIHFHETGRPWITLKWAMTLDGCTSAQSGMAYWITGEAARRDAHRLRAAHACVAVGIGTILTDDPQLTVRGVRRRIPGPLRLVVDSGLILPEGAKVIGKDPENLIVATCEPPESPKSLRLRDGGIRLIHVPPETEVIQVSLTRLVRHLGEMGVQSILVEGGRRLAGAFYSERLADRVVAYLAPRLLGSGNQALGPLLGGHILRPSDGPELTGLRLRRVGNDVRLEGYPKWETSP